MFVMNHIPVTNKALILDILCIVYWIFYIELCWRTAREYQTGRLSIAGLPFVLTGVQSAFHIIHWPFFGLSLKIDPVLFIATKKLCKYI